MIGSKEGQDFFATLFNENRPGYFLDLGSAHPIHDNNTIRLEHAGWRGLAIDIGEWAIEEYKRVRQTHAVARDLTQMSSSDFCQLFEAYEVPKVIDYISFDVDEASIPTLKNFPFEQYSFKCMTFEHDAYNKPSLKRDLMNERLAPFKEYFVLGQDICYENRGIHNIEDWWVSMRFCPRYFLPLKTM